MSDRPAFPAFPAFPRPRVVLSKCLEVEACRYNGHMIRSAVVRGLQPFVDFVPVCPEVEVGLGTPRDPIRLVRIEARTHLVQPSTGRDITGEMEGFARGWLGDVGEVDGFILKSRSPSCGIDEIPVYPAPPAGVPPDASPADTETGMFARAVLERFPDLPVEHEARLADPGILDAFLTRIFALAELRRAEEKGEEPGSARAARRPPYPEELVELMELMEPGEPGEGGR